MSGIVDFINRVMCRHDWISWHSPASGLPMRQCRNCHVVHTKRRGKWGTP